MHFQYCDEMSTLKAKAFHDTSCGKQADQECVIEFSIFEAGREPAFKPVGRRKVT